MKSIDLNDFTKVGYVIKSHGNNGFLKISLEKNIKLKEWVMFLIKQKPVPFFVEEWQRTTDTEAIIKCQDINTVDSAEDFVALDVLLHKSGVKRKKGNLDVSIIGYRIFADGFGEIGILNEIIEEEKTKRDRCLRIADRKFDKPSAYKSGAVVRCRAGKIWKDIKEEELNEDESLHKWFQRSGPKGKEGGWVDCNAPDGKGGYKACGRKEGEKRSKYPACRPTPAGCKAKGKGKTWGKTK